MVVDWPETAKFLTDEERALLIARLSVETGDARMDRLDKRSAKRVFGDWKIYCGIIMYIGVVNTSYSTSVSATVQASIQIQSIADYRQFFIPTIIKQMGYTSASAQLRSVPIYIVATAGAIATAFISDRLKHRYSFTIIGLCISATGYIILLNQTHVSVGVRYAALFLITPGAFICHPVVIAWVNNCMGGHYKRAIGSAMMIGFGNGGGLVASNIFVAKQAPR